MSASLTEKRIAALKPRSTPYYISDDAIPGLQLRVAPSGAKSWSVRFRIGRHQRRLSLGDASVVPLSDKTDAEPKIKGARSLAREAVYHAGQGVDVAAAKREAREADTFGDFSKTYIEEWARKRKRSWRGDLRMLDRQVLPYWKHRPLKSITPQDVSELLHGIAARAPVVANRTHGMLSKLFQYAKERFKVEANPLARMRKVGVEGIRQRVLSDDEIRLFWKTTEALSLPLRALWRIRLLTGKRPGEVVGMKWEDIDLQAGWWTNPGTSEKNGIAHHVALSSPVIKMLRELNPQPTGYVFEGVRGKKQHAVTFPLSDFLPKDLRKTASTNMAKLGIHDEVIDAMLNHVKKGMARTYNLHGYDPEKRVAADAWARALTRIIKRQKAEVLAFSSRG